MKNILILGATNKIGINIAKYFNCENNKIILTGSNLNSIKKYKDILNDDNILYEVLNFLDCDEKIIDEFLRKFEKFDYIYLVGAFTPNNQLKLNENEISETIKINYEFYINFLNFLNKNEKLKDTHLILISSIAVSKSRKNNTLYGSNKIAMEFYIEGLRDYNSTFNFKTSIYKLGFLNNYRYNVGNKKFFPAADCKKVAKYIYTNRDKEKNIYYPLYWNIIALALKILPKKLLYKFNF